MSNESIFCIVTTCAKAEQIVGRLKSNSFSNKDISVLFQDNQSTKEFSKEQETKAPEGAVLGASTGAVLGGALGWIAGIGAFAIPGVGPFIAAGPIMAALGGVAVGAAAGGIAGGLIGLGVQEIDAKRYEEKIKNGNILISVHPKDSKQISLANETFEQAGAQDICLTRADLGSESTQHSDAGLKATSPLTGAWAPSGSGAIGFHVKV